MKLPDAHQTRLFHSNAFALNSFLAIPSHPLRDGAPTPRMTVRGMSELMLSRDLFHMSDRARTNFFCDRGNSNRSNQVFSPRQEFFVLCRHRREIGRQVAI